MQNAHVLPTASNKRYNAARKLIRGTINVLVASRARQRLDRAFKEREHKDILKYFLEAHEEDGLAADKETLSDNLITLLFGGYTILPPSRWLTHFISLPLTQRWKNVRWLKLMKCSVPVGCQVMRILNRVCPFVLLLSTSRCDYFRPHH
jgi:hypothetical protein